METKNIMIVGVGGQGTLLASKLLGRMLLTAGYDVKVSEVHGMSQRGGSVVTYVRWGDKVYSPIIDKGQADFILSFELLEAARWTEYLKPGGKLITNTQQINPMPVITGAAAYPQDLEAKMAAAGVDLDAIDALALAEEAGQQQGGEHRPYGPPLQVVRLPRGAVAHRHRGERAPQVPGDEQKSLPPGAGSVSCQRMKKPAEAMPPPGEETSTPPLSSAG